MTNPPTWRETSLGKVARAGPGQPGVRPGAMVDARPAAGAAGPCRRLPCPSPSAFETAVEVARRPSIKYRRRTDADRATAPLTESDAAPAGVDVRIEAVKGSRNKYIVDPKDGQLRFERRTFSTSGFPGDYGYIPGTAAEDGHPLDSLILVEEPTVPGCLIRTRPVAILWLLDTDGPDGKIISVPADDPIFFRKRDHGDLDHGTRRELETFFGSYKDDIQVMVGSWDGMSAALSEIAQARQRYEQLKLGEAPRK